MQDAERERRAVHNLEDSVRVARCGSVPVAVCRLQQIPRGMRPIRGVCERIRFLQRVCGRVPDHDRALVGLEGADDSAYKYSNTSTGVRSRLGSGVPGGQPRTRQIMAWQFSV